jgi:predicted TIM-barrel fold metal-dependent hydrolase/DNA-binding IclR family transcriptional regulator
MKSRQPHDEPSGAADAASKYRAPALDKSLDIIELLASTEEGLTQADIAKAISRSANEIFRMLDRLQRRDYIRRTGDRYELTRKLFALSHQHSSIRRLVSLATPILRELSRRVDQRCHIAVHDRGHGVVVAQHEAPSYYGRSIRVGSRIGLFNTDSGHALLAFTTGREREMMIREYELVPGERRLSDLEDRLNVVRQRGYEELASQQIRSVVNLSAPILGPSGNALAVLTLPFLSPLENTSAPDVASVPGLTRTAAHELSQIAGGAPKLIDTHCHLIYLQRLRYPWLHQVPPLNRDFMLEDYLAQARAAGITDVVYMEVDVDESQMEAEVEFASGLGESLKGIVAACRPESDGFAAYIERIAANPRVKGVRRVLHTQADALSQQKRFAINLRRLAQHGLSFDLCVRSNQLPIARQLAQQCPDVQFVLDHCGNPDLRGGGLDAWRADIHALAELPNVACKLSGIITQADPHHLETHDFRPVVDHVIEQFGWNRVLWGSDWPVCTLAAPLGRWMDTTKALVADASYDETGRLFSRNAERIYRLE